MPADTALIDGELVSRTNDGVPSFSLLQQALKAGRDERMTLYAFDLLHLDGTDHAAAAADRTQGGAGERCWQEARDAGRFSQRIARRSAARCCSSTPARLGLEGIISKRADAPYHSGRGHDWLKTKCSDRQEFVVAGFAPSTADAHAVGALVLGVYDHGELKYAGRTGTGFTP